MRRQNNYKIGDVIRKLMQNPKLANRLEKLDAIYAWEEIVGKPICNYITDQKIHKNILYIKLKSSVIRNELSYKKTEIINEINQKIGKNLINDIVLR